MNRTGPTPGGGSIETPPRSAENGGAEGTREATTVRILLERLAARGEEPSLRGASASYRFDLEDAGRWHMRLVAGAPKLSDDTGAPDCIISASAGDFIAIAEGTQNMVTAFLQGRVGIVGDIGSALALRRLFPVTP